MYTTNTQQITISKPNTSLVSNEKKKNNNSTKYIDGITGNEIEKPWA